MAAVIRLIDEVLKGGAVVDGLKRLACLVPKRAEDAVIIERTVVVHTRSALHRTERPLYEAYHLADRYRIGRLRKKISAILAARGIYYAGAFQTAQNILKKANGDILRLGDGADLAGTVCLTARKFIYRSQCVLTFLCDRHNPHLLYQLGVDYNAPIYLSRAGRAIRG